MSNSKKKKKMTKNNKTKKTQKKTALKTTKKTAKKKPSVKKASGTSVKKAQKKTKPGKKKLPFKQEMKKKLLDARKILLQEVEEKVKHESNPLKFEIGDIYDIASSERERELTLMLGNREREKLLEIDRALERLIDKDYGVCEECGELIGEERLRALPFTTVCVDCKSRFEKESLLKVKGEEETGLGIVEKSEGEEEEY